LFDYDPETDVLSYKMKRPRSMFGNEGNYAKYHKIWAGKPIKPSSNRQIWIDGKIFLVHRIIWKMATGREPSIIDHANRDNKDNRRHNLRTCTMSQNAANRHGSGGKYLKGTRPHHGGWIATIGVRRRRLFLGYFPTEAEAHAAYCAAGRKYFGKFFHDGA